MNIFIIRYNCENYNATHVMKSLNSLRLTTYEMWRKECHCSVMFIWQINAF